MLDVQPPDHSLHGVRDFTIHLLTITVGLLIALGLEAGVEWMHHRNQRNEAEATIRQELRDNRSSLLQTQATLKEETANMMRILNFAETMSQGKKADATGLTLSFTEHSLQDAAWKTAAATGVLAYMDYPRVQTYAMAYQGQAELEAMEAETLEEYLLLDSYAVKGFDPSAITANDLKEALPQIRHALAHLAAMQDLSRSAMTAYNQALQ
jgi:hypothetical protein